MVTIFVNLKGLLCVKNLFTHLAGVGEGIGEVFGLHVHYNTISSSVREPITQPARERSVPLILEHKLLKVLRSTYI